ncbi:hypothetical protein L210DRAFT_2062598 [Boletus edulis BED1]|uniref:DUF6533 domain-containing protein n=1 Tax=Boletus edulis BED1 TaxID=1328754 RepID=A0AAD4CA35_BOLED|nr:hypothetical protein L210DRAFT_2062598 [Boletus edulis BED1]
MAQMAACPALYLPGGHTQPYSQLLAVKLHLMSTKLQSTLELLVLTNYMYLVIVTAVVYDHVLTFAGEVEYIWRRPWTWVSTIFVVIRYIGLCWIMTIGLIGSSFLPGPLATCVSLILK